MSNMSKKTYAKKFMLLTLVSLGLAGCNAPRHLSESGTAQSSQLPHTDCDLAQLKDAMRQVSGVTVIDDPAGAGFEATSDLQTTFKDYAEKNHCQIYVINMQKLVKGLLKGNSIKGVDIQKSAGMSAYKYITMDGQKARCAKTLGLQLPIEAYGTA